MYDELVKDLRRMANTWLAEEYKVCAEAVRFQTREAADAIEELSKPKWIPVTERLPDQNSGNLYICLIVGGEYDQLSWYELCDFAEGRFWTQLSESECHVTHWMPLPEPPKEE